MSTLHAMQGQSTSYSLAGDGYFYSANNYRMYHEPSLNQWTLIPWGLDQTLSLSGWGGGDIYGTSSTIGGWCLAVPSCLARYQESLEKMAQQLMNQGVEARVLELHKRILPLFEAGPYREATPEQMTQGVYDVIEFVDVYPQLVLDQLP